MKGAYRMSDEDRVEMDAAKALQETTGEDYWSLTPTEQRKALAEFEEGGEA